MFFISKADKIFYTETTDEDQGVLDFASSGRSGLLKVIDEKGTAIRDRYFDEGRCYREVVYQETSRLVRLFSFGDGRGHLGGGGKRHFGGDTIAIMEFFTDRTFSVSATVPIKGGQELWGMASVQGSMTGQSVSHMLVTTGLGPRGVKVDFNMDVVEDYAAYNDIRASIGLMNGDMKKFGRIIEKIVSMKSPSNHKILGLVSSLKESGLDRHIRYETAASIGKNEAKRAAMHGVSGEYFQNQR